MESLFFNKTYYISLTWCYNNILSDAIKLYSKCLSLNYIQNNLYDILYKMLDIGNDFNKVKFILDGDNQILLDINNIDFSKEYVKIIAYNNPNKIYQINYNYVHRYSYGNITITLFLSDYDAENKLLDILEQKIDSDHIELVHFGITTNSHIPNINGLSQLNNTLIKDNNLTTSNLINIRAHDFTTMVNFDTFITNIKNHIFEYFK